MVLIPRTSLWSCFNNRHHIRNFPAITDLYHIFLQTSLLFWCIFCYLHYIIFHFYISLPNYSALPLKKTTNFASAALPLIYLAQYNKEQGEILCNYWTLFPWWACEYSFSLIFFVGFNYFPPTSTQISNYSLLLSKSKKQFCSFGGFLGFIFVDRHGPSISMDYFLA